MQDTAFEFTPSLWMTTLFALTLVASVVLKFWLATRQVRHVAQHRDTVPPAFAGHIALADHQKAADYTMAQARLGLLELAWGTVVILCWTLLGGLHALNQALLGWFGAPMESSLLQQLALLVCFSVMGSVVDLPFSIYRTFVLEQRFGFNRMTPRLWLIDGLKGLAFSALIGVPLAGPQPMFLAVTALYLFASTALGIFLATLARSIPQFGLLSIPVIIPMLLLSGGTTPLDSMPTWLQWVMQVSPSTHFVSLSQAILFRHASLELIWPELLALTSIGLVFFAIALGRFRKSLAA